MLDNMLKFACEFHDLIEETALLEIIYFFGMHVADYSIRMYYS